MKSFTVRLKVLEAALENYINIFWQDFYLEIQRHETYDPEADMTVFPSNRKP